MLGCEWRASRSLTPEVGSAENGKLSACSAGLEPWASHFGGKYPITGRQEGESLAYGVEGGNFEK